jgi:hypothetical protein
LLQKSLSPANSANIDQYLFIKNENQAMKNHKAVTINKQNCQPALVPKSPTSSSSSISPEMAKLTPRIKTKVSPTITTNDLILMLYFPQKTEGRDPPLSAQSNRESSPREDQQLDHGIGFNNPGKFHRN